MRLERIDMIDRIVALDVRAGTAEACSTVPSSSTVFEGHFPGHPIMPGVLLIETMAQAAGLLLMARIGFARMALLMQVERARFRRLAEPGAVLETDAALDHDGSGYAVVACRIGSGDATVCDGLLRFRLVAFPNGAMRAAILARAAASGMGDWVRLPTEASIPVRSPEAAP